jgi:hypothetical protein
MTGFDSKQRMAADKLQEPEREALKLLEEATRSCNNIDEQRALDALMCEALAQPAQEPVAWMLEQGAYIEFERMDYHNGDEWTPLYTTPPQRPWVGLTDEEIAQTLGITTYLTAVIRDARAIEQLLKEKNT